jgi:YidC/Oxa1 family membrane protein insertase
MPGSVALIKEPGGRGGLLAAPRRFLREVRELRRLFAAENRRLRTLCFYSERDIDHRYFEGYIDYVLAHSSLDICYLTSDPDDPVFGSGNPRIHVFYLKHLLAVALQRLDGRAVVMTMPDLGLYHLGRDRQVKYVYVFHGVGSIHLQYRKSAFDAYDTIFCVGPYDRRELRRAEELYRLPAKDLVEAGYPWIERIFRDHQAQASAPDGPTRVLVAPSWHDENILAACLPELLAALDGSGHKVTLRPHPETLKRKPGLIQSVRRRARDLPNVDLELDMVSGTSIHQADVLITDWSAISFEFAFGTERPVLFIDTPCKVQNPDYAELGLEPIEFSTRAEIGRALAPGELGGLPAAIEDLLRGREGYRQRIVSCRERTLSNWMSSDRVGGEHLIRLCERAA